MKTKSLTFLLALTFLFLFSGSSIVFGGDYQDGLDAFKRKDYKTAYLLWLPLAVQGNAEAQSRLSFMNEFGLGVPQDFKDAGRWMKLAAEQGFAQAQYDLGRMHFEGLGVIQDYKEAIKWYRLAAEQGNAKAQVSLGLMYYNGNIVPRDNKEAVKWFRLAAEQGNKGSQTMLGYFYENGQGVPQDNQEAVKWYRLAAEQGDAEAQKALKTMEDTIVKNYFEEEDKKKEQEKVAAEKAEFNKLMESAEKYRPVAKEFCEKDEDVSKCTTFNSCVIASLIKKLKHDDRVKKFKKTVEGSLFSKGSPKKASDELRKSLEEDELFLNQVMKISTRCLSPILRQLTD